MPKNPFASVNTFVSQSHKALQAELDQIDKAGQEGVDISNMLNDMSEKVANLQRQAEDMLDYIYNQEARKVSEANSEN